MAFQVINTAEIEPGKPVSADTQTKIKENFDDHESRLQSVEASAVSFPPVIFRWNGYYNVSSGILKTTANFTFEILGVRILVDRAGTAGNLQIDIQKKRGVGAFESIFTALPIISYTAGNDSLSVAGTLNPTKIEVLAGDILRLDITSSQTGGIGFLVRLDYNKG